MSEPLGLSRVLRARWRLVVSTAIVVSAVAVLVSVIRTEVERKHRDLTATATATFTDPKLIEERIAGERAPVGSPASKAFDVSTFLPPAEVDGTLAAVKDKLGLSPSPESLRRIVKVRPTSTVGTLAFRATGTDPEAVARLANATAELAVVRRQQQVQRKIQAALVSATSRSERRRLRTLQSTQPAVAAQLERKAVPPQTASVSPGAAQSAIYGLVASFLLGIALAVLIAARDRTMRHSATVVRATQAPIVATIPDFSRALEAPHGGRRLAVLLVTAVGAPLLLAVAAAVAPPTDAIAPPLPESIAIGGLVGLVAALVVEQTSLRRRRNRELERVRSELSRGQTLSAQDSRRADVVESYRWLRVNVGRVLGTDAKSILVTSYRNGEGKSTAAVWVARGLAELGRKVLLIEADFRHSVFADRLSLNAAPGTIEVLQGEVDAAQAAQRVTAANTRNGTGPAEFDVLVAGTNAHGDPSALLPGDAMAHLLRWAETAYDVVVVDAPSLPRVADALPLVRLVDGVLLVTRLGMVTGPEVRQLADWIRGADAGTVWVVANGAMEPDERSLWHAQR